MAPFGSTIEANLLDFFTGQGLCGDVGGAQQRAKENEVVFGWQIIRLLHFMGPDFLPSPFPSFFRPPPHILAFS